MFVEQIERRVGLVGGDAYKSSAKKRKPLFSASGFLYSVDVPHYTRSPYNTEGQTWPFHEPGAG